MDAVHAILRAGDVQSTMDEIDLIPSKGTEFSGAQPMPVGDEDHGGVPVPPAVVPRGLDQALDLLLREVFADPIGGVGQPTSRYCSLCSGWDGAGRGRIHLETP